MEFLLSSWPTLILLGIGLRMALRLTYGVRGPEPGDPLYIFLSITSGVLIGLAVVPAVIGSIVSFFGIIILLLAIATLIESVVQRRSAQRRSMCRMLVLLMDRGTQLESSVLLAGQTMRGGVGQAAKHLFNALRQGTPLPAAILRYPAALPRNAPAYLAAGHSRDVRLAALRELSRTDESGLETVWRTSIDRFLYLAAMLLFMAGVFAFVMIKIVPEYAKIFDEFGLSLPAMTQLLIVLSSYFQRYLAVPIVFALLLAILGTIAVSILYLCDIPVLSPLYDRIFRGRRTAEILRILALATEYREPLDGTLHRLALVYPSRLIRGQLLSVAGAVQAGIDWRVALVGERFISKVEHNLLETAERVGNLPWALRRIAERRDKRAAYRLMAVLQFVYPIAILMIGMMVAFYAVSLFIPIVKLIYGLSP
jgi:general secretion pathway protein F